MEDACLSNSMVSMELIYDDINMCRRRTVTRTFYTFPDAMTHAKTETDEQFQAENADVCCQAFAEGEDSLRDSCIKVEGISTESYVWDGSMCNKITTTSTQFLLPVLGLIAKTEFPETVATTDEANCISCEDEIQEGSETYEYDVCTFTCQMAANTRETCFYSDLITIASMSDFR